MEPVHRGEDGELCGFIECCEGVWVARTAFGAPLASCASEGEACEVVLREGLASLAERWTLMDRVRGVDEVVCIQEVSASGVRVALGYYSMPGVPTRTISADELASGSVALVRGTG
jgi:hypothetical protein